MGLSEFLLRRAEEIGHRFMALHRARADPAAPAPMLEARIVDCVRALAMDLADAAVPQDATTPCAPDHPSASGLSLHRLVQEYAELHESILDAAREDGVVLAPADGSRLVRVVARRICAAISAYVEFQNDEDLRWAEMSERAHRMRGELLSTVSEELRAPLHVINLCTQLLVSSVEHDELAATLAILSRNVARQADLVDELVGIAGLVSGHVASSFGPVAMVDVVRDALLVITPMAEAHGVSIDDSGVVDTGRVHGDRPLLQQCVTQLLMNAVKLTPAGGRVSASLQLSSGESGDRHHLQILDAGPAIPIEVVAQLFDPYAADGASPRAHDGLGLGLSLVRHIVELHGGSVNAQSSAGVGARFEIVLPAHP